MATSNDRLRARYGICLSDSCPKCKDKTVQIITGRKDFVCEECGKPLREVPRPQTAWEKHGKKIIGGVAAVAIIGGAAAFFTLGGGEDKAPKKAPVTNTPTAQTDTTKKVATTEPEQTTEPAQTKETKTTPETDKKEKPTAPKVDNTEKEKKPHTISPSGNGTIKLGYGTYRGETKNGKPHGHGTITFTASHKIVASKDFVAQPGDKFEGEFREGNVSGGIGYWYHDGDITAVKP